MTAEIAVLNRSAIALAADSAVTVEHLHKGKITSKVYNSANKLFSLSKYRPIGAMFYNAASLAGVPWETLVKVFREDLHDSKKGRIPDYADAFFAFLQQGHPWLSEDVQKSHATIAIAKRIIRLVDEKMSNSDVRSTLDDEIARLEKFEDVPGFDTSLIDQIPISYEETIKTAANISVKESQRRNTTTQMKRMAQLLLSKKERLADYSGLVVAGFGDDDVFPSLVECNVDGVVMGKVRRWELEKYEIDDSNRSFVVPFADKEVINTILNGINPRYWSHLIDESVRVISQLPGEILARVSELTDEQKEKYANDAKAASIASLKSFFGEMQKYRIEEHRNPIQSTIEILPTSELAVVAENFLNVSQVYKRMSPEIETVGGPVDVAVISRGDGLVWIKRKHYFKAELNPSFAGKYFHK